MVSEFLSLILPSVIRVNLGSDNDSYLISSFSSSFFLISVKVCKLFENLLFLPVKALLELGSLVFILFFNLGLTLLSSGGKIDVSFLSSTSIVLPIYLGLFVLGLLPPSMSHLCVSL